MNGPRRRQRGIAAIEMAGVLGMGTFLVAATLLFGRFTWHAIVVEKAVQNAARAIAALPAEVINGPDADVVLNALARQRVLDTTGAAGLDIQPRASAIEVECDTYACGSEQPTMISVEATIRFTDPVFGADFMIALLRAEPLAVTARATLNYVP